MALRTLAVALLVFAAVNAVFAVYDASYQPKALLTEAEGPENPEILVVAGSYGQVGLQRSELPPGTATWWCEGTSVSTWERLDLPAAERVVLALSPAMVRDPGVFNDLPLRRLYGLSDLGWLIGLGEMHAASEVLASRLVPLYRMRQGIRKRLLSPVGGATALPKANSGLPAAVAAPWTEWKGDALEIAALQRMASPQLVVAEWPMSSRLDVHDAIRDGFRVQLAELAEQHGFLFLPLPEQERYALVDAIHPTPTEGRRWSRWLAESLN